MTENNLPVGLNSLAAPDLIAQNSDALKIWEGLPPAHKKLLCLAIVYTKPEWNSYTGLMTKFQRDETIVGDNFSKIIAVLELLRWSFKHLECTPDILK